MTRRYLLLLRHAEASAYAATEDGDRARGLTENGIVQAQNVGRSLNAFLHRHDLRVTGSTTRVLCSPSTRTRQTAAIAWAQCPTSTLLSEQFVYENSLYNASETHLLDQINSTDISCVVTMLIGHNPGIGTLARTLCAPSASEQALTHSLDTYPPATLTAFCTGEEWSHMRPSNTNCLDVFRV